MINSSKKMNLGKNNYLYKNKNLFNIKTKLIKIL